MPLFQGSQATIHYEQSSAGPDIVWLSGAGGTAGAWSAYQLPFFRDAFRNTTFDCRGVGTTVCESPPPWTIEDFARDTAELIAGVCDPPVALVGLSMGAGIAQQVALDSPDLVRCAIAMGTGARSVGWTWDYSMAEIEWRRAGGRLDGMMAVAHYAALFYPARVLGDRELWPKLRDELLRYYQTDIAEDSLIAQWEPSVRYDQTERLPDCRVPLHVIAFDQDVAAPPQGGEEVAALCPTAEYHLFEGMGHCSIYGHSHDVLNPFIRGIIERYL